MGRLSYQTMQAIKDVAAQYDNDDYPIKISNVVKLIDRCKLKPYNLPEFVDAKTVYDPVNDFSLILINKSKLRKPEIPRMRFSIAHEIGHIVLDHIHKTYYEEMEDEADEFAGCVLMPEDSFMWFHPKTRTKIFYVSQAAAYIRAENIRLRNVFEDFKSNYKFYCI